MIDMGINQVIFGGNTLIDLSSDTVTPETLLEGKTAHDASGAIIIGSMKASGGDIHTVTSDCDNANEVVAYFRNLRPNGCNDMIIALKPPDDITALSKFQNGQMLTLVLNGTKAGYSRWYSSAVNVQTTFTTSYTCKCFAGDEYYIFPIY